MYNKIKFKKCVTNFNKLKQTDIDSDGVNITISADTLDLDVCNHNIEEIGGTIFKLWIECGKKKEKTIMINLPINEFELFVKSVLNHIDIIRKSYGDQIKKHYDMNTKI